jgi:hypothetical protein
MDAAPAKPKAVVMKKADSPLAVTPDQNAKKEQRFMKHLAHQEAQDKLRNVKREQSFMGHLARQEAQDKLNIQADEAQLHGSIVHSHDQKKPEVSVRARNMVVKHEAIAEHADAEEKKVNAKLHAFNHQAQIDVDHIQDLKVKAPRKKVVKLVNDPQISHKHEWKADQDASQNLEALNKADAVTPSAAAANAFESISPKKIVQAKKTPAHSAAVSRAEKWLLAHSSSTIHVFSSGKKEVHSTNSALQDFDKEFAKKIAKKVAKKAPAAKPIEAVVPKAVKPIKAQVGSYNYRVIAQNGAADSTQDLLRAQFANEDHAVDVDDDAQHDGDQASKELASLNKDIMAKPAPKPAAKAAKPAVMKSKPAPRPKLVAPQYDVHSKAHSILDGFLHSDSHTMSRAISVDAPHAAVHPNTDSLAGFLGSLTVDSSAPAAVLKPKKVVTPKPKIKPQESQQIVNANGVKLVEPHVELAKPLSNHRAAAQIDQKKPSWDAFLHMLKPKADKQVKKKVVLQAPKHERITLESIKTKALAKTKKFAAEQQQQLMNQIKSSIQGSNVRDEAARSAHNSMTQANKDEFAAWQKNLHDAIHH